MPGDVNEWWDGGLWDSKQEKGEKDSAGWQDAWTIGGTPEMTFYLAKND